MTAIPQLPEAVAPAPPDDARRSRRTEIDVTGDTLQDNARRLLQNGFRIAAMAGHDDGDRLRVVYLFTQAGTDRRVELQLSVDPRHPHIPSLGGISFAAGRFEREIRDLFGIVPDEHPLPSRMVRHFHWPRGWYPMLAAAGDPPAFGAVDGPLSFRSVEGPGVYEIPVGPVHAGMIGPGHFRFSVVGETVLNLKARLWFVHRGIEKLFQGRLPADGIELAERISGDTSVGHALAYCRAVEDAMEITVPVAAQRVRAILLELERLYNHIGDIGALCNDVGHSVLNSQALAVREQLQRINDRVTGSRLLRGGIAVGGAQIKALPDANELARMAADVADIVALALGHSIVLDRFTGTAVLTHRQAVDLGTLGYVARASGLAVDARFDHPVPGVVYPAAPPVRTDGDVLARFLVRAEEFAHSVTAITDLVRLVDTRQAAGGVDVDLLLLNAGSPAGADSARRLRLPGVDGLGALSGVGAASGQGSGSGAGTGAGEGNASGPVSGAGEGNASGPVSGSGEGNASGPVSGAGEGNAFGPVSGSGAEAASVQSSGSGAGAGSGQESGSGATTASRQESGSSAGAVSGVGIAEGWRGTIVHRVELDAAGRLSRVKVVDPSFFNWPALPIAMADTIVPDFPLANKSFNQSYAGNDL